MQNEPDLADDLLTGATPIAKFLGPPYTARKVYHLHEKGAIPTFTLPGCKTIHSRKSALRRAFSAAA
jgi:hypothetical protein